MAENNKEIQKLAAVVLFKELHSQKIDVYDVLTEFIKEIYIEKGLSFFTAIEMSKYLNEEFGFDSIPLQVIKTTIKRIKDIELKNEKYYIKKRTEISKVNSMMSDLDEQRQKNQEVINDLCNYVESRRNVELTSLEKNKLVSNFCAYLFDENIESEYVPEIAAYFINLKSGEIKNCIENITQGIYQYSALTYNEDLSKIDSLRNEITLILDTDILLSLGGFHGIIFKKYIDEMLTLVNDINNKTNHKYIKVKYFDYTMDGVEDNFKSAKYYLKGLNQYVRDAARNIAEGCHTNEDIILKKAGYLAYLKNKGISLLEFDSYAEKYQFANLEGDEELYTQIAENYTHEDFEKASKRASDINKLREGIVYKNFEDTKYIFITNNRKVSYISSLISKEKSSYYYVMNSEQVTNILWHKMNKGLANCIFPFSMNIITKSQVVLAGYASKKMSSEMDVLKAKIEKGELSEDALVAALYEFKCIASKPEDITETNLDDNLAYIESDIKNYGEELSLYKTEADIAIKQKDRIQKGFEEYRKCVSKKEKLKREYDEKKKELVRLNNAHKSLKRTMKILYSIIVAFIILLALCLFIFIPGYLLLIKKNPIFTDVMIMEPFVSVFAGGVYSFAIKKMELRKKISRFLLNKLSIKFDYSEADEKEIKQLMSQMEIELFDLEKQLSEYESDDNEKELVC